VSRRPRKALRVVLWVIAGLAGLAVVRPWTVRPLHLDKRAALDAFDATTFAQTQWPRLLADGAQRATDVTVSPDGSAAARFVTGSGIVTAVDRTSRVGLLRVQVTGLRVPVAVQVGPVIRGTAIRDASSFIQFSQFTNQSDYAAAANALNDYALRTVIAPLALDTLQNRMLTFTGAVGRSAPREDGAIELVPIRLAVAEAASK
jgi:predicted lipoprotein